MRNKKEYAKEIYLHKRLMEFIESYQRMVTEPYCILEIDIYTKDLVEIAPGKLMLCICSN